MTVTITDSPGPHPWVAVRIPGGAEAPLRARRSVLAQLGGRLTEAEAADVALIVSELATNSVLHADVSSDQTMTLQFTVLPARLRISITDPGSEREPHRRRPGDGASGGFGLGIVEELSSAWGVVRDSVGTTSVWCELPLAGAPGSSTGGEDRSAGG